MPWAVSLSFLGPSTTSTPSSLFYLVYLIWYYYLSVKFVMWIVKLKIEHERILLKNDRNKFLHRIQNREMEILKDVFARSSKRLRKLLDGPHLGRVHLCGQSYQQFTILIYDSRIILTRNFAKLVYNYRVVNCNRRAFIRLAAGRFLHWPMIDQCHVLSIFRAF